MIYLLTHYTSTPEWEALAAINVPILQEYADKHGYELIVERVEPYEKYDGLHKLKMFDYLEDGDVGLFLDGDTLLTNLKIPIEHFSLRNFEIAEGLNCGVMIIRKTKWSTNFIKGIISDIESGKFHCEQDAIEDYFKGKPDAENVRVQLHPCFNSFIPELYAHIQHPIEITEKEGRWMPKQFLCHVPSQSMGTRLNVFRQLQKQIVR